MNRWLKLAFSAVALYGAATQDAGAAFWPFHKSAPKHVVIDKSQQMLRAYEGNRVVMESRISTGKRGKETPSGHFTAESKSLMHRSRLYDNAPMPFSVQVAGNYFIHGFSSVPGHPASHGCIRLPLSGPGGNPARNFYNWVSIGTPVDIVGAWGK